MFRKNSETILFAFAAILGLGRCAGTPNVQEFAATANPVDELNSFTKDVRSAHQDQADVLSPSHFERASNALKTATERQRAGKDAKDVLHEIAVGRAELEQTNHFAAVSRSNLEAVVAARKAAIVADAPNSYAGEFAEVDERLRSVTSDIEGNNVASAAENRTKLQKDYLDVETKAIKHTYLAPAQATMALATKEGGKDLAKQSYAVADKKLVDADLYITANAHQTDEIKSRANAAIQAADHYLKITRAAKSSRNESPEQVALALEKEQDKASEAGDLKAAQAISQKIESARGEFASQEAEVYQQGDRLIIRLKTLEFPSNQSVLRGSNFPLLAKVAKVIKEFEDPAIVIEGHTDSDGAKDKNLKLSTERARAISDYLISNNAIPSDKVTVTGYGYERPLATNKTAKGKAQNRRVDIIISPRVSQG